jgi:hypothetical protein
MRRWHQADIPLIGQRFVDDCVASLLRDCGCASPDDAVAGASLDDAVAGAFASGVCAVENLGFGRFGRIVPCSPRLWPPWKYAYESPVNGFMLLSPLSPPPLKPPPPPAYAIGTPDIAMANVVAASTRAICNFV